MCRVPAPPGADDHENVAGLRHPHQRGIVEIGRIGLRLAAVIDDVDAERPRPLGDLFADPPEAEDAHRAAAQRGRQRKRRLRPAALAQIALGLRQYRRTAISVSAMAVSAVSASSTPGVWVTTMPCSPAHLASM